MTYDVWAGRVTNAVTVTINVESAEQPDVVEKDLIELVEAAGATQVHPLLSLEIEAEHLERKEGIAVDTVIIWAVYVLQKADADPGLF